MTVALDHGKLSIKRLKKFAAENLSPSSPLRDVLLSEKDWLSPSEFLAKAEVWLALLRRTRFDAEGGP